MTCTDVFEGMANKFQEFGLRDVHGVFQFHITGPEGGKWHAICRGDHCRVDRGVHPRPDVTITADDRSVVKLALGRMNPALALLTRKVKVRGDLVLMARLKDLLARKVRFA
ncbi:MAG: SCP2 sterol-binding domain-containing protein [Thermodesulfobacteriota bacterium]